jgi:hypothetical protein
LEDSVGQEAESCPGSPSESLKRTALELLRRKVRVPQVKWEPENTCGSACTGGYIPLHLKQLLAEAQSGGCAQMSPRVAIEQKQPLLGRAVLLPDGSDYLFCSHDCAGMCSHIAWNSI